MSATNTNVQDNGNVLDSSNSSSDTQRNNTPTLTAVKTTDNDKTSDTSKTKADQKGDTPGTIASVEQDNGNVPDISNSSSGTQINNMSTLTAVVTHDNDKTYDISKTSVGNNTPDNILVANKVHTNDDESVRTRLSVDKSIDASTMSRDQTITNLGMTQDKPSSIDTNGETYPAVTLATDGVETKSWSNQQITYSLYTVLISVLVSIVCSCLVSMFLVPQLVTSVTSVTSVQPSTPLLPDPKPCLPTYDPRIDELVEEVKRLKQSASCDAFRKEVAEQIKANADKTDAFESELSSLKNSVKKETESREGSGLEREAKVTDVNTRIDDISERINDLQDEVRTLENGIKALERNHKSLREQVEHIQEVLKVVPGLQSNVRNLTEKAEIQESHIKSVIVILTNSGVGPLHIVVALLFTLVLYSWYLISSINRQHHRVVHSGERTERENVSRHEPSILERVAVPGRLDNTVCILGFYKSTLELRTRLTQSVLEAGIKQTHFLVDSHEDILRLPPCRLFLVFVDINERHVILEDPSLGLGDLRVTTVRALEKMGASMVVIYYGDRESRNIGDHLFNRRLTSVQHQSELSALCKRDRFFSTAYTFTDRQIHALKKAVASEIN